MSEVLTHDSGVRVRPVHWTDATDRALFDQYVRAQAGSTPFHLTAWGRAIESLGHQPRYLLAERDGIVAGILPLIETRSPIFGRSLLSNAFAVYGGPIADSAPVHGALDAAAWAIATSLGLKSLEYRNQERLRPDWPSKSETYATFKRPLSTSSDDNLKAIPRKQRAEVRKSLEFGLETRTGRSRQDLDHHFAIYAESVRNLGTPVFPRRLFAAILDAFGDDADILTVYKDGRPMSSVLSLYHKEEVLPYYGGGNPEARNLRTNEHMYWMLMEHARTRGCTSFDFGRSKTGTGPFAYKKNWGFEPTPLHYEFKLADGTEMPDLSPNNPKYKLMINTWTKLPLWVANRLGPLISRGLG